MKPFYENKDCAAQSYETSDLEFPEHLHGHVEILLVLTGGVEVKIMERRQELKAGDCAVIFPQQIHSYHKPAENRSRLFIFDDSLAGMYLHPIRKYVPTHPFLSAEELPEDGKLALDRIYLLSQAGLGIANGSAAGSAGACGRLPSGAEDICSAWIQVLFALIWSRLLPEKRDRTEGAELTCQLVQYVTEHFQEPLTLETLARELHMNKFYISHIFSDQLQINFRRYLSHIRLEYAMQLMKTNSSSLIDICSEAGFNSLRSFNRAFVDILGMTPGEYRKTVAAKR